jgi:hypothetical protein
MTNQKYYGDDQYTDLEWDGINHADYPDYCDACIESGKLNGVEMTDAQLDELNDDRDLVYELLQEYLY